jgi:hypothetical protein
MPPGIDVSDADVQLQYEGSRGRRRRGHDHIAEALSYRRIALAR